MKIKKILIIFFCLLLSADFAVCTVQDKKLDFKPFSFHEDFENRDPFLKWADNGTYTINYKGLSEEKASSGKKSFKLDITLKTATYVYFKIPVKIPSVGKLKFKGDIFVSHANGGSAALGTNVSLAPCPRSGVNILTKHEKSNTKWETQSSDLVEAGLAITTDQISSCIAEATNRDVGIWLDRIGLFLFGQPGSSITVFIDNIIIEGQVPDTQEYFDATKKKWDEYRIRVQKKIDNILIGIGDYKNKTTKNILKLYRKTKYLLKEDYNKLIQIKDDRKYIEYNRSTDDLMVFNWKPTSKKKVLPDTFPIHSKQSRHLKVNACPGEYEPVTFILRAQKDITNITISPSDLYNLNGDLISASAFDIKYVKCWYQASDSSILIDQGKKYLVPELLLKDDSLVKVDYKEKINFLKVEINGTERYVDISDPKADFPQKAIIQDAYSLQPINLEKQTNKQVWITALIPEDAKPGVYKGHIFIRGDRIKEIKLNFDLEVHNFKLSVPILEYSIYYRGKLTTKSVFGISSEYKTKKQYKNELENMINHGVRYPTIFQRYDETLLPKAIKIRDDAKLSKEKLYVLGLTTGNPKKKSELESLRKDIKNWQSVAGEYKTIYFYGMDERKGKELASQRSAWDTVHSLGGKIFVACYKDASKIVGDILDLPIINGKISSIHLKKWHSLKKSVFSYANPQVGIENPLLYRENYGLKLFWKGFDGAMPYAYQHSFGHIWNDFDHGIYRDHVFAYPTSSGVIDTIQWEGFREGVDDIKYLSYCFLFIKGEKDRMKLCEKLVQMPINDRRDFIIFEIKKMKKFYSKKML